MSTGSILRRKALLVAAAGLALGASCGRKGEMGRQETDAASTVPVVWADGVPWRPLPDMTFRTIREWADEADPPTGAVRARIVRALRTIGHELLDAKMTSPHPGVVVVSEGDGALLSLWEGDGRSCRESLEFGRVQDSPGGPVPLYLIVADICPQQSGTEVVCVQPGRSWEAIFVPCRALSPELGRATVYEGRTIEFGHNSLGVAVMATSHRTYQIRQPDSAQPGWPSELDKFPNTEYISVWDGEAWKPIGLAPDTDFSLVYSRSQFVRHAMGFSGEYGRPLFDASELARLYDSLLMGTYHVPLFEVTLADWDSYFVHRGLTTYSGLPPPTKGHGGQ
jgi:hypothetical protein